VLSFLVKEGEDPVVEIVRRKEAVELTVCQLFHRIRQDAVRITIDDRNLILLIACELLIIRERYIATISRIDDAGILYLDVVRRLEVDIPSDLTKE
jgi:hypothetical protein